MSKEPKKTVWREYINGTKRYILVTMQKCPSCGVHETPQPISEKTYAKRPFSYDCDGCEAYKDHLR